MIATALIIGAVVGGAILIAVVITATVCCLRRHPWLSALRGPTASFSGLDRNGSALHERAKHRASVIAARVHESKHDARNRDDMISKTDNGAILQSSQRHSFSLNDHRGTGTEEDGFDLSSDQVTQRPRDATCIDVGHTAPEIVIDAHISPKNQTMTATLSDVLSAGGPFDRTHTSEAPHAPHPHRANDDRNFDGSGDVLDALSDEGDANAAHRRRTTNAADFFDDETTASASRRESDHFSFGDVQPAYGRSAVLSRNPISHPPTAEDEYSRSNTHQDRSDGVSKGPGRIGQEVESVTNSQTQNTSRVASSSPQSHARAKRATVASLLFRRSNDDDSSEASMSGPPMGAAVVPAVLGSSNNPTTNANRAEDIHDGHHEDDGDDDRRISCELDEGDQQLPGRGSPTRRTIPSIQSSMADLPKSGLQSLPIVRLANVDFDDAWAFRGSIDAARRAKQLDFTSDMSEVKRVAGANTAFDSGSGQSLAERAGSGHGHEYGESHMPESFSGSFPVLPPLFASSQGQLSSDAPGGLTSTASSQIPPGLVPLEKSPPRSRIAMPKVRIVQNVGIPLQKSRGSKSTPTKTTTTTTPTTTGDAMTAEDEVLRLRLMRQQRRDSQADGAVLNSDDGARGIVSDPSQYQDEHDDKDQSGSDNNFNFSGAQFLNETEGIFGGGAPPALVPRPSNNLPSRQPSNPFGHIRRPAPFVLGAAPEQNIGGAPGGLGLGPGLLASLGSCDDNNVAGGFGFGGGFSAEGFSPTVSRGGGDAPTPIKRAAGERTVVTGLISGQNSPMCGRPVHLFAPAPLSPAVQAPVLADSLARVPSQRSLYSALMVCSSSSASSANSSDRSGSDGVGGESLLTPVAPAPRRQRRATSGHRVFTLDSSATSGNGSFF